VWRRTEQAGAAYVALQTAQVEDLERTLPAPARGAGAQLVQGEGAAVKTVALGHVQEPVLNTRGEQAVQTTALSSFSRLADQEKFRRLAPVQPYRRGTETASAVCAVGAGAAIELAAR
jgi:hypothetical protein